MRAGPEGLPEVNCNGHVEVEQRQSQWRDEDQHNGNAEATEKCASEEEEEQHEEEQHEESPAHHISNGVDSADLNELDIQTEGRGAHSSGVPEILLPAGLEEGELDQSILEEEGEDGPDCRYRTQESPINGQLARVSDICYLLTGFVVWFVLAGLPRMFNKGSAMWTL